MSTLASLFPTLLALYITVALITARELVDSYDRVRHEATSLFAGINGFTSPQRVAAVVGLATLWPLTWATIVVLTAAGTIVNARARRGA